MVTLTARRMEQVVAADAARIQIAHAENVNARIQVDTRRRQPA